MVSKYFAWINEWIIHQRNGGIYHSNRNSIRFDTEGIFQWRAQCIASILSLSSWDFIDQPGSLNSVSIYDMKSLSLSWWSWTSWLVKIIPFEEAAWPPRRRLSPLSRGKRQYGELFHHCPVHQQTYARSYAQSTPKYTRYYIAHYRIMFTIQIPMGPNFF